MISIEATLSALAEPTRRNIVERLARGPQPVSALAEHLATSLSATIQHLAVLEASGLVRTEKNGRVRVCHLQPRALKQAEEWFAKRRKRLSRDFDRLEQVLDRKRDLAG